MNKYKVMITGKRIEYSTYNIVIEAKSLEEAKAKAKELADDDDGEFADNYSDCCDPGDAYDEFTVEEVKLKGGHNYDIHSIRNSN